MSKKPSREMIWNHVQAIGTCMMVTHDGDGVRARPMRGIPRADQNTIWFFASKDSHPNIDLHRDACLTYVSLRDNVFVSLSGSMIRVFDTATINDLWNDEADSYFSEGPDDSRLILLQFQPDTGEYWSAPSSPIVIAIKFLEAKLMGERPSLGTSGRTRLP